MYKVKKSIKSKKNYEDRNGSGSIDSKRSATMHTLPTISSEQERQPNTPKLSQKSKSIHQNSFINKSRSVTQLKTYNTT